MSKSYFISDVHLGAAFCDRKALEQRFVTLLDRIREERADAVYLLGDIFDFWYEYRYVIPRGHTRAADIPGLSVPWPGFVTVESRCISSEATTMSGCMIISSGNWG